MTRRRPPSLLDHPSYLAAQVSKVGRRHLEAVLVGHGLVLIHHALLSALDDFGALSQQQLADALDLDKSHLVGRLDQLEGRSLVDRTPDPRDRRRNQVALTSTGKALIDELRPAGQRSQQVLLNVLTAPEQETLVALLRRVLLAADDGGVRAG